MKKILNIQSRIITYNIYSLALVVIYSVVKLLADDFNRGKAISLLVYAAIFGLSFLLYKLEYFNKMNVYIVFKVAVLFVTTSLSFNQESVLRFFFVFYSLLLLVELSIILSTELKKHTLMVAIVGITLIIIAALTTINKTDDIVGLFITVFIIVLGVQTFYALLSDNHNSVVSRLNVQTRLFKEAAKTNNELRLSQNKFKLIHEEMAKQKYDLEVANKRLNKMTAEIYTQNELLRYISSVLDIKELLDLVTDAIMGTIGVDTCSLVLFDEQNEEYLYNIKSNHPGDHMSNLIKNVEAGLLQKFFETGKIHLNNRVIQQNYPVIANRPVGSIAIIPLLREDLTYGLLVAEHSNVDMFTENNVQFFRGIATQITIAINNANIYALMEDMAIKDGLTGIYNRKYLLDHIEDLTLNAKMTEKPLSIALFDIDHFKSVNDKYGHLFGDEAIKMAAFMTQRQADENNGLAIRYGGEEFVLVLPDCTLEKAKSIVEKLHKDIKNEVLIYHEEEVHINVSLGISCYPEVATHGQELLLRADNAMYYSKEHGRGQLTLDDINLEKVV